LGPNDSPCLAILSSSLPKISKNPLYEQMCDDPTLVCSFEPFSVNYGDCDCGQAKSFGIELA